MSITVKDLSGKDKKQQSSPGVLITYEQINQPLQWMLKCPDKNSLPEELLTGRLETLNDN